MTNVYNGNESVALAINHWDKKVHVSQMTNGLQYMPDLKDNNISAYDNQIQRNILYKFDSETSTGSGKDKITVRKFTENTLSNSKQ